MAQQPPIDSSSQEHSPRAKLIAEMAQKKIELERAERELRAVTRPSEVKPKEEAIQKIQKQLEQLNIQNNDLLPKSAEDAPLPAKPAAAAAVTSSPAVAEATEDATFISTPSSADAVLTAAANQKTADDKKAAEKDAELKSAAAQASTLTPTGTAAKAQPILEAETDESKKQAEPKETEKFPQFPSTGSWIKQLMWLLDILMFNSGIGRPPIIDKEKAKGFIQKLGEGFANLSADFKKAFPNAHRLISGTVGAAVNMTANAVRGVGKIVGGGLQLAQGIIVTAVAAPITALIGAPLAALAAPKGQGLKAAGDVFGLVNQYGIKPLLNGGARFVDGVGNVLSTGFRGVAAARDAFTGAVGMIATGVAKAIDTSIVSGPGEGPAEQWVKGKVAAVEQNKKTSILDKAALVLSGHDPEYPSLVDRLAGVVPKASAALAATDVASPNLGVQASISPSIPAPTPTVGTIAANVQSADVNYAAYQKDGRDVTPAVGSQGGGPITSQLNAAESNAIHPLTALVAAAVPAPVVPTPVPPKPDDSVSQADPSSSSSSPKIKP